MPRPFWALFAATLVNRSASFVGPFLVLYLSQRGLDVQTVGLVSASAGLGSLVAQPLGGVLADAIGRRETMVLSLVATAASYPLLATVDGALALFGAALLSAAAADLYRPAGQALVADLVPEPNRTRAYGLIYWAVNIGFVVAALTAGTLAEESFTLVFVIDGVSCLLTAVIIWRLIPAPTASREGPHTRIADVLRDRLLLAMTAVGTLSYAVFAQAYTNLSLAMKGSGYGPSDFGRVLAVNGIAIIVLQPLLARWIIRFAPERVLPLSLVLMGVGFGLEGGALGYAIPVLIWTLGEILDAACAPALIARIAPERARGRYLGIYGIRAGIGFAVGPPLGAWLLASHGEAALWRTCLGVGLVLAVAQAALAPALRRRQYA